MDVRVKDQKIEFSAEVRPEHAENGRPLRILHISDLHFGAGFDPALWDYISDVLGVGETPDIIAVTGDLVDTPSFFMLAAARRELHEMRARWCTDDKVCELIVVPGNHDVGIYGNFSLWPWSDKFGIVFSSRPHSIFDAVPTYGEYRSWKWYKRWAVRAGWSIRFGLLRLMLRLRSKPRDKLIVDAAGGRVCFASLDSNSELKLASGRVNHDDIMRIHGELLKRRHAGKDRVLRNLVPRIALVHHHVIPIPYAGATESATEFEPFLVLRNAGTLLRELCEWDFDLILHGHKHFLNFARLTFDSADDGEREVGVLAAGSATSRQSGAGANSFNLVKVYPNGSVWFRSLRYGQGQSAVFSGSWDSEFKRLLRPEKLKRRLYARAVAGQQICCELKEQAYKVDDDGSADVSMRVSGICGTDDERVRVRHVGFSVGFGAVDPASVRLDADSVNAGHRIQGLPSQPSTSIHFNVQLGGAPMGAEEGMCYEVSARFMNSFAVTQWECRAMGQPEGRDWVAACVRVPTRKLRLSVELPPSLQNPDPRVVVDRDPDFPLLELSENGDVEHMSNADHWQRDPDFTHLEKDNLRWVDDRWVLEVDYPVVGHRYQIKWTIDIPTLPTTTERQCLALQLRRSLIDLCEPADEQIKAISDCATGMLSKITDQILRPLIGTQYSFRETLDAALFVYDDEQKNLRVVASAVHDGIIPAVTEIPLNAGVGGAAFKSRRVKVYLCPQCSGKGGVYVYFPESVPESARTKFAALIAFPLQLGDIFPDDEPRGDGDLRVAPEEVIGVFTIGSTAFDSKLVTLDSDPGVPDSRQQELTDGIWSVATQYLRALSDEIRNTRDQN